MEDLESKCYDKFDFRLEDLQILIVKAGKHCCRCKLGVRYLVFICIKFEK